MKRPCGGALVVVLALAAAPATADATHTPNHRTVMGSFSYAPVAPIINEVVTFTSGATAAGSNNRLVLQDWDLDNDGAFDDAAGATAALAFAPAGAYVVRHRAVDRYYNEAVAVQTVTVHDPPPTPLLNPFPVVQMAGRVTRRGTRVRLTVKAPIGATITITCRGRGCALRRQTRIALARSNGAATTSIRIGRLERRVLRRGALVRLYITKPGTIGKYARFQMRRHRPPRRTDQCVTSDPIAPITCPTS